MTTKDTHISLIRQGDTVLHDGKVKTVSGTDRKRGFMGVTIFGDSYRMGTIPVKLVVDLR